MNLSIIIPLYNEAVAITSTLDRLCNTVMPEFVEHTEVIIVDDNSTDDSARLAEEYNSDTLKITLVRLTSNSGKGAAVAAGIRAAEGDTILVQDADLELDPSDIPALLEKMYAGKLDLVSGTRFGSMKRYPGHALVAVLTNRLFSFVASKITGREITDLTCGYKVLRKDLYNRLHLQEKRFGFETEMMIKALKVPGTLYGENSVNYYPRRKREGKKIRISDGFLIAVKLLKYGLEGRRWLSALTVALIIIVMTGNMLHVKHWKDEQRVIEWDAISYYAYLPAAFVFHDMSLSFIDGYHGPHKIIFWPEKGPEGKYVIKTTMGLSLLWIPFFIAGHITALVSGADAGGFSEPYKFFLLLAALTYLLCGLIFLRRILLASFSDSVTAMTVAGFALATNLYWYTLFQGTMSHVFSFALIAMFIWYSIAWHSQGSRTQGTRDKVFKAVRLGLLAGIISLIRPTNIIIIIFFLFYGITTVVSFRQRMKELASDFMFMIIFVLMIVVIWLPQMVYWKEITGHWFFFSYGSNERFFFSDPAFIKGLFSYRKGLFVYTPVMLFALAGIFILWIRRSPYALPVTLFFPLNAYIIFSWWCWWYGGGFGQRAFIDSYALMAVPVAALLLFALTHFRKAVRISVMTVYMALFALGILNNIQYYHGAIHWDAMTHNAYWDSFGRIRPSERFNSLLEEPDYEKAREGAGR